MTTRAKTRTDLEAELKTAREGAEREARAAQALRVAHDAAIERVGAAERKFAEAKEKITELEIVRDAPIALVRKMKSAIAPGAWTAILPYVVGIGLMSALLPMILGKST